MIRMAWQNWRIGRGSRAAAIRFVLAACLMFAIVLGSLPVHVAHAGPSFAAAHSVAVPNVDDTVGDASTMADDGDCVLHIACQGGITVDPSEWAVLRAPAPRRPAGHAAPDSLAAPPLPQPPNFS